MLQSAVSFRQLLVRNEPNQDTGEVIDFIHETIGEVFYSFGFVSDNFNLLIWPFLGGFYQFPLSPERESLVVGGWLKVAIKTEVLPSGVFVEQLQSERVVTSLKMALRRNVECYVVPKNAVTSLFSEKKEVSGYAKNYDIWYFIELDENSLRSIPRFLDFASIPSTGGDGVLLWPIGASVHNFYFLDWPTQIVGCIVGGTTGSGKSTFLRQGFLWMVQHYSPSYVNLWLGDFKQGSEFKRLGGYEHVKLFTIMDDRAASKLVDKIQKESDCRFETLYRYDCTDIIEFNRKYPALALPMIIIGIDEWFAFRDLYNDEAGVQRLASVTRAAGLYWLASTQRPDVKVITGGLKAVLPTRFCFSQASQTDYGVIFGDGVLPQYVKGSLGCAGRGWALCQDKLFEFQSAYVASDFSNVNSKK